MAAAPEVGCGVNRRLFRFAAIVALYFLIALPARAGVYYVTVSGLGGEPDYEQRFTAMANDLDKLLKAGGSDAHVYTLSGADATKARMSDTLGQVAKQAKPEDDFVLILIGHGSFDGVEYKFNLVGPDISGRGTCRPVRPHRLEAPVDRQHH